jgi:ribonuclease D
MFGCARWVASRASFVHDRSMKASGSVTASSLPFTYVDTKVGLEAVCDHLAKVERFGLDTEFLGERTYVPQLELIQVATADRAAVLDCRVIPDLEPFFAVLANAGVEKVLHSGQQDVELFHRLCGAVPRPMFDTQIAAAMAGYGAQPGYANLVERLLGVSLDKAERLTDWSRRPLTREQLAYAVDDVWYLLPLYERLRKRLGELERWEFLQEELRQIEDSVRSQVVEPQTAYLRVRGRGSLRARGLAVLRELAAWREELACKRNKPRNSVVRDEALVEIARKAPTTVAALRGLRGIYSRELERQAEDVLGRIRAALEMPREQWPQPQAGRGKVAPAGVVEVLQGVLRARAEEAHVAPGLLATNADLQLLVQGHATGEAESLPILQGWRRQIVGADLLALLDGDVSIEIVRGNGHLHLRKK